MTYRARKLPSLAGIATFRQPHSPLLRGLLA